MTRFVSLLISMSVLFVSIGDALACSCAMLEPEEHVANADAIFWGTVTKTSKGSRMMGPMRTATVEATFDVKKSYKGGAKSTASVSTAAAGTACGVNFEKGESYLVFAHRAKSGYRTSSCTATRVARSAPPSPLEKESRDLSRQERLLKPRLQKLMPRVAKACPDDRYIRLSFTFYENGEFDVSRGHECAARYVAEHLKTPDLPAGYPFGVRVNWFPKKREFTFHARHQEPLRKRVRERLSKTIPPASRSERLLHYQLHAIRGRASDEALFETCMLSGQDAAERYLKKLPDDDHLTEDLREDAHEVYFRCAVARHDWAGAEKLSADLSDRDGGWFLKEVVKKTRKHAAKGLPIRASLADLDLEPTSILRHARTAHGWNDDPLFLDLLGKALVKRPGANDEDRELAAMAYVRASLLRKKQATRFRKQAIAWVGEEFVEKIEKEYTDSAEHRRERERRIIERRVKGGASLPSLEK